MIHRNLIYISLFVFCSLFFLSCGQSEFLTDTSTSGQTDNSGSITFKVNWKTNSDGTSELQSPSFDCTAAGVFDVALVVYDSNKRQIANSGTLSCSAHSGAVTNVTAGSNLTLVFLGKTGGSASYTPYRGEVTGITVTASQTTDVGTITAYPFIPTLSSPDNNSTASSRTVTFSWSSVTGASIYTIKIYRYESGTMVLRDKADTTATTYTTTLSYAGSYSWEVNAYDVYDNFGQSLGRWVTVP